MDTNIGESASRDPQNSSCSPSSSGSSSDADNFECNICLDLAQDPIVTLCGHLFCWPCLYKWLHLHANSSECPVCKVVIKENQLVPLYGRGKTSTDLQYKSITGVDIPQRPPGLRPATAPQANPNHYPHGNPWFMGGAPMANGGWGNYTFSPGIGGLFPMLGFQVHGFPGTGAYGPAAGFPHGFGRSFHGRHGHGAPEQAEHGHQPDAYLKTLLILVGSFVVASLVMF